MVPWLVCEERGRHARQNAIANPSPCAAFLVCFHRRVRQPTNEELMSHILSLQAGCKENPLKAWPVNYTLSTKRSTRKLNFYGEAPPMFGRSSPKTPQKSIDKHGGR